jgi:hypothetical protein
MLGRNSSSTPYADEALEFRSFNSVVARAALADETKEPALRIAGSIRHRTDDQTLGQ